MCLTFQCSWMMNLIFRLVWTWSEQNCKFCGKSNTKVAQKVNVEWDTTALLFSMIFGSTSELSRDCSDFGPTSPKITLLKVFNFEFSRHFQYGEIISNCSILSFSIQIFPPFDYEFYTSFHKKVWNAMIVYKMNKI